MLGQNSKTTPNNAKQNRLIDYANDWPFALAVKYHLKGWLNYVRSCRKRGENYKFPRMHNVSTREAHSILFGHI